MKKDKYNIAILGATGLVGRTMVNILEERDFPVGELKLLASKRSAGSEMVFKGMTYQVEEVDENSFKGIDIALFSPGKTASHQWAPVAAGSGCVVIDNSSGWRMHPLVPLVVPEVNPDALKGHKGIIANPNCSTIQLVVALKPIHDRFGLKRVIVSTYQSITGAGQKGIDQLMSEIEGKEPAVRVSSHKTAFNTVFHSITDESGFSEEEIKMVQEPRKIMGLPGLQIAVTCVRLPILGGHGESVNIETGKEFTLEQVREALTSQEGLVLIDNPQSEQYPTPQMADGTNPVYVGRIRKDETVENGLYLWVVADNVRKGAATNAVQIAELLIENDWLGFQPGFEV